MVLTASTRTSLAAASEKSRTTNASQVFTTARMSPYTWTVIEATDRRYRDLTAGDAVLAALG